MRKKVGCFLCAALLIAGLLLPAAASVPYVSDSVAPPTVNGCAERETGTDREISLFYTARTAEVETVRRAYLEKLLEGRTREEIAGSDAAWILHETVVFCEVSADGKNWHAVKSLGGEDGEFRLSLMEEILPALAKGGEEMYRRVYGFDYALRLVTASDDYAAGKDNRVFAMSAPSEAVSFHCPEFTFVDCVLPEGATLSLGYPAFMYYPNAEELPLSYPERKGYFFAGWLDPQNGVYTETVPARSRYFRVVSQWDPRSYAVNYVLSTCDDPRFSYAFGRADNSRNPTVHTVGSGETLYPLKSPVGGFDFDGWYAAADFSGPKLERLPEDAIGDTILYARWITFEERDARTAAEHEKNARETGFADLDDDGKITSADARLALRMAVGLEQSLPPEIQRRADIYDTGIVTPATARTILRISVGLDSLYAVLTASGIKVPGTEETL